MVALFCIGAAKADFFSSLDSFRNTVDHHLAQFPLENAAATVSSVDSGRMEQSGVYPDFCRIAFDIEQMYEKTIITETLWDIHFLPLCIPGDRLAVCNETVSQGDKR